jgi:hypothetical protein
MEIYILIDNQPQGPYTPEEVRKYLKTGQFQPATLGAYPGSSDWKPLEVIVQSWDAAASVTAKASGACPNVNSSKIKRALSPVAGAIVLVVFLAVAATLALKTIHAHRRQPDIQGAWEGVVQTMPGTKLRVVLHVSATNGSYGATCDCIDTRAKDIPVDKFVYNYPSLEFESKGTGGSYAGTFNAGADEVSGTWKQSATAAPVVWKRTATADVIPELLAESDYTPRGGSDLQGYWKGTLNAGWVEVQGAFKIAEPSDGKFAAEMDCIDQGLKNVVVSAVTYDKPDVRMEVGSVGAVFEGKLSSDGGKITGTWTQARVPIPLTIERADPKADKAKQETAAARDAGKDYSHASPNELPGRWKGMLQVQKVKLHLRFNIAKLSDGSFSATLESPDQAGGEISASSTQYASSKVLIEWKAIGVVFKGALKNGKLSGTFQQRGMSLPLVLSRD